MKTYYTLIQKITSWKTFLLLLLLFFLFMFVLFPMATKETRKGKITEANRMLDTRFSYTTQTVKTYLSSLSERERKQEAVIHFTLDLAYPIIYLLLLSVITLKLLSLLINLGTRIKLKIQIWIVSFPLLIVIMDYLENTIITILLLEYPAFSIILARICSTVTTVKWLLVVLNAAIIILLGTLYLARLALEINKNQSS